MNNADGSSGSSQRDVLVSARNLEKKYVNGENVTRALNGVSLDIRTGELLVILGSSGCGKSTLLNMLGGMDQPDSGKLIFKGVSVTGMKDRALTHFRRKHIGFVFQNFNLISELTALENVELTADRTGDAHISEKMLALVGLQEKKSSYPSQMSGGEQQRVSIARALAKEAELLLCDEPTGALDSATGKQILIQLEELSRSHGKTVVIVTHTQEIGRIADRVIRLRDGRVFSEEINGQIVSAREIEW